MTTGKTHIVVFDLGLTDYAPVWELQKTLVRLRIEGRIPDVLLLTEHRHVYTLGKNSNEAHLLADDTELRQTGADLFHIERGGDITYHGPGQLVAYPILDLHGYYCDAHRYVRDLEEVILRTSAAHGVQGARDPGFTGVWVGQEKIAAIGVKISRWVTMHGLALNCTTDLRYFDRIIPCGIFHRGVTSLGTLTGVPVAVSDAGRTLAREFAGVFGTPVVWADQSLPTFIDLHAEGVACPS